MKARLYHSDPLTLDSWHPAGSGAGVLRITGTGRIVDAAVLRKDPRQRIFTDEPEAVCRILGVSFPDRQVYDERAALDGFIGE